MASNETRRRTVTVLFSDLVDSTDLGGRLDPETLRDALDRYFAASSEVIAQHGGVIEKFIGDAIVAVFGMPTIHEDDALRAVRAAVEMQEALALVNEALDREFGVRLQTRTGVNTGEVVAGDPSAGQRIVTGDAVNVAARLEQSAPVGSVLIGEMTYALVHAAGEFERLQPLSVKGKAEPLLAYRVEALAALGPEDTSIAAPFVNRIGELAQLHDMLVGENQDGVPIVVLGEAGIGKSRLVSHALETTTLTVLRGRCLPYGEGITYWPLVQVLRSVGDVHTDDDEHLAYQKLRAAVRRDVDDAVILAPLVSLLSGSATYPAEELARAFGAYVEALASDRDLALLIEDVHWAEPTFLDLIDQTARLGNVPVICTARPEFIDAAGKERRAGTHIELNPLEGEHTEELVLSLAGSDLAAEIRERLVDAAGGNPFFLEQIVAMLREEGTLTLTETREGEAFSIPPSVAVVLDARLDRLPPTVRDTAEKAAVIGKIFYREAVETLGPPEEDVGSALTALISTGFIEPSPSDLPGQEAFAFRHILIHDAFYRGTLKRRRADWHERLGMWIEHGAPAGGREEFIGFHLERAHRLRVELGLRDDRSADLAARASQSLAIAGRRAADRNDASAAARLLGRAIELLSDEDQADSRVELMVELALARLDAGSAAEALLTARSAERDADNVAPATTLRARAAAVLIELLAANPDLAASASQAQDIVSELQRLGESRALVEATLTLGIVEYSLGQMGSSTARLDAAANLAREVGDRANEDRALDWLVVAIVHGPMPVSAALRRCDEVIAAARPRSRVEASARACKGMLLAMVPQLDTARDECDEARSISEELGMPLEVAASSQARAAIELLAGDPAVVVEQLRRDRDILAGMNAFGYRLSTELRLAEALDAIGDDLEAMAVIDEVKQKLLTTDTTGLLRAASVEVHSLMRHGQYLEAEAKARGAVKRAASTDDAELLPTALTNLADVLVGLGEEAEARGLLNEAKRLHLAKEDAALATKVQSRLDQLGV